MYLPSYSILEETGGCSGSFSGYDKAFLFVFVFAFVFAFILCLSSKKESKCGVQWLIYWIWQCGGGDRHPPPIAHVLGSTHIVLLYMLIMMMMMMMMIEIVMIVRMSLLATMYIYDSIDHKDDVWWLLSAVRKLMLMKRDRKWTDSKTWLSNIQTIQHCCLCTKYQKLKNIKSHNSFCHSKA